MAKLIHDASSVNSWRSQFMMPRIISFNELPDGMNYALGRMNYGKTA